VLSREATNINFQSFVWQDRCWNPRSGPVLEPTIYHTRGVHVISITLLMQFQLQCWMGSSNKRFDVDIQLCPQCFQSRRVFKWFSPYWRPPIPSDDNSSLTLCVRWAIYLSFWALVLLSFLWTFLSQKLKELYHNCLKNECMMAWFMVFNTTFNYISAISWQSVLLVKNTQRKPLTCRKSPTNLIT
jgi:hypothetical protein